MKEKIKSFLKVQKPEIIVASVLAIAMLIALPTFAWFNHQRKVAELQKIQYPNSLYINAAYREDQIYFGLDTVDITEYKVDEDGQYITVDGVAQPIDKKEYVFSVSGANIDYFTLQLAHTNNNLFIYDIFEATQFSEDDYENLDDSDKALCVKYVTHNNSHTENPESALSVEGDPIVENAGTKYYKYGSQLTGEPIVGGEEQYPNGKYKNPGEGKLANGNSDNYYYKETYNTYSEVEAHAVPSYWQAQRVPISDNDTVVANKKPFCRYFILRITWNSNEQAANATKESDMVYLSVVKSN